MKKALIAAALTLVAGTTAGCGGDPPEDASTEDFCQSFEDFDNAMDDLGEDASTEEQIQEAKDQIEQVREVGTPEDMSSEEREGYDIFTQTILDLDDDASEEELDKIDEELSEDEQDKVDAFFSYADETCSEEAPSDESS